MDANGDQQLVADEIPADYRRAFEQMLTAADDDKNGRLDRREIAQGSPKLTAVANMAAARMGLNVSAEVKELPEESMNSMEQMDAYPQPGELMKDPAEAGKLFARLDANGDKQLTAGEVEGPLADRIGEMIRRGDRNGDQQLNKREFLEAAERISTFENAKPNPAAAKQAKRQLLNRFDRDGDSALTVDEAPPRLRQNFDRADADGNGKLEGEELQQVAERMARLAPAAENRNGAPRPAMNEDSPGRKSSRKLKGKSRAEKNAPI
jgi:Ca2+-binding EF-hand superfamily protein